VNKDFQYTSLTLDKKINSLMYRTLFYVNIYGLTNFQKTVWFLWPTLYLLPASMRHVNMVPCPQSKVANLRLTAFNFTLNTI